MAFTNARNVDASSSIFTDISLKLTNITNYGVDPITEWLHKECAPGALYDAVYSPLPCSPGTREGIMGLISDWISDPNSCSGLCWLSGPVGTGKSAIAKTISERCANEGRLAASFFCSRRDTDRSDGRKVISTIAVQLTGSYPSLRDTICTAVKDKLLTFEKAIPTLFQNLIVDPLIRNCRSNLPRRVVVIDALDECNDQSAKDISRLIADAVKTYDLPLQFLVTSRPTSYVEVPFIRNHSVIKSLTLSDFDVHNDIRLFLSHRFEEIYEDHSAVMREVARPWPSDDSMDRVIGMCNDLFIFAASIARFVDDHNSSPDDLLKIILSSEKSTSCAYAELDQLYKQTLIQCKDTMSLRLILGTIISLRKPLPLQVIAVLLRSQITIGHLRAILHLLRPVLVIPANEQDPITTFHQSFRDFLTDKTRSGNEFYIDPEEYAVGLADSCLDLLTSSESESESPKGTDLIALEYARTHYVSLLTEGKVNDGRVLEFIQLSACNSVALVAGTLLSDFLHNYLASPILCRAVVYLTMAFTFISLYFVMFLITDDYDHLYSYSGIVAALVAGFEGGGRCFDPVICGSDTDPIVRVFTGGAAFDMVLRAISGLNASVACAAQVPTEDVGRSAIRTIISGASFDLVILAIIWIYVFLVKQRARPTEISITAARIVGIVVGRGMGAALITSTDIIGLFWSTICLSAGAISSTILLNLHRIPWLLACFRYEVICFITFTRSVFLERPIKDSEKHYYIWMSQYRCRWIRARFAYTLKRHKIQSSFTAPLYYAVYLVEFYIATVMPTHALATTFGEQPFCEWCHRIH